MSRGVLPLFFITWGCGGKVEASPSLPDAMTGSSDDVPIWPVFEGGVPVDATDQAIDTLETVDVVVSPAVDSTPAVADTSATPAFDCFGDVGPSIGVFIGMSYLLRTCRSGLESCVERVQFDMDTRCAMKLGVPGADSRGATADDADCAALKRWATSKVLLDGLEDPAPCGPIAESPVERTIVYRSGVTRSRTTFACDAEPIVSQRACIAKILAKYFTP